MRPIQVVARDSSLSKKQVEEVERELKKYIPDICFDVTWMKTTGDLNLHLSLMTLDKTNFFTKELDEYVLKHPGSVAIHSAKDLPDPLPEGLSLYALTQGVDPSDALVLGEGSDLATLPPGATIGTSSIRRIEAIKALRPDFVPVDIRGTIERRLTLVYEKHLHGVVIAEAALIRLGLTHLHRVRLQGEIAPLQGKLAVVGCQENLLLQKLFQKIHAPALVV